jgi:hypothetical protein
MKSGIGVYVDPAFVFHRVYYVYVRRSGTPTHIIRSHIRLPYTQKGVSRAFGGGR